MLNQFRLPDGVKCIVADDRWLYAGCDDGNVYDLGGKVPREAYEIAEDVDIFWLDIKDAVLGVSDANGKLDCHQPRGRVRLDRQSKGTHAWMVRCDEVGIYHGHAKGVTMYDWEDGEQIWQRKHQRPRHVRLAGGVRPSTPAPTPATCTASPRRATRDR